MFMNNFKLPMIQKDGTLTGLVSPSKISFMRTKRSLYITTGMKVPVVTEEMGEKVSPPKCYLIQEYYLAQDEKSVLTVTQNG